jgi:hypothetical protein
MIIFEVQMTEAFITKYDDYAFLQEIESSLEKTHGIVFNDKIDVPDQAFRSFEFEGIQFRLNCIIFLGIWISTKDDSAKAMESLNKLAISIPPPSYPL